MLFQQTSVNQGPASRFADKTKSKTLYPKMKQTQIMKRQIGGANTQIDEYTNNKCICQFFGPILSLFVWPWPYWPRIEKFV